MNALKLDDLSLVTGRRLGPQDAAHLHLLVEDAITTFKVNATRLVFLALPTGADAYLDTAARHHIERRQLLGQQHGRSQR